MSITAQCRRCKSVSSTDSNPIAGFEILGIYQNDFVVVHVWLSNRLQHELHAKEGILSASSSLAQTEHSNRCHARVCPASGFSNEWAAGFCWSRPAWNDQHIRSNWLNLSGQQGHNSKRSKYLLIDWSTCKTILPFYLDSVWTRFTGMTLNRKVFHVIDWLALGRVVPDLVQEQFLDRVELLGAVEDDRREADVPAQGQAHGGAQHGGQLEQPMECHLKGDSKEEEKKPTGYVVLGERKRLANVS